MRLSLRTDRRLLRAEARSTRYLLASITAPTAPARATRMPVSVGFVLDRSGSMDGDRKFGLAREAVEQALRLLRPEDRFTLVVYDQDVDVLAPAMHATPEAKALARSRLRAVGPRGSTDLHGGWSRAAAEIGAKLSDDAVTRVLVLTDGLANHGITDPPALLETAGTLRRLGIATTTFGVGADFDERLLRDMALEGGGNFYFIASPAQIADHISSELGEALEVVSREAVLHVDLPAGAEAEVINRFRETRVGDELRVELGDLVSAQELRVVVRIRFASGTAGAATQVGVRLSERSGTHDAPPVICEWRYADHAANDSQPRDVIVDREVASLYAARARAAATEANRRADFGRARHVLERTAWRIEEYAGNDAELHALARALRDDVRRYAEQAMSPMQLKSAVYVAESAAKNRGSDGRARRSPGGYSR